MILTSELTNILQCTYMTTLEMTSLFKGLLYLPIWRLNTHPMAHHGEYIDLVINGLICQFVKQSFTSINYPLQSSPRTCNDFSQILKYKKACFMSACVPRKIIHVIQTEQCAKIKHINITNYVCCDCVHTYF